MLAIQALTVDSKDPYSLASFWATVLDGTLVGEPGDESVVTASLPQGGSLELLFLSVLDVKETKNRLHLDLRPDNQAREVARLESLGATKVDIGQNSDPDTTWIVMADPEGNEFCVLRAL